MGEAGHEERRIALDRVEKRGSRVPEEAQLLIFYRNIRYTIVKLRKTLDKGDPECSGFRNKDRHVGEGWQRKGRS